MALLQMVYFTGFPYRVNQKEEWEEGGTLYIHIKHITVQKSNHNFFSTPIIQNVILDRAAETG